MRICEVWLGLRVEDRLKSYTLPCQQAQVSMLHGGRVGCSVSQHGRNIYYTQSRSGRVQAPLRCYFSQLSPQLSSILQQFGNCCATPAYDTSHEASSTLVASSSIISTLSTMEELQESPLSRMTLHPRTTPQLDAQHGKIAGQAALTSPCTTTTRTTKMKTNF